MAAAEYQFDLAVLGGGSGGLAASKAAAALGARVVVCDFVQPSAQGTTWGLGGTCVNVGCIPKKLMHTAALLGHSLEDARHYGWAVPEGAVAHSWEAMVEGVQNHIGSLNWGYRTALNDKGVKYLNAYATFVDAHTLKTVNKRGKEENITAKYILIATGGRPSIPDIPGAREFCLTSDDLFALKTPPGKTLVVGASYVALECAGFLAGLGFESYVMVRSIFLRGFDQQMAGKIAEYMANHKVTFIREAVPLKVEKLDTGALLVTWTQGVPGAEAVHTEAFDTVVFATGRYACTSTIDIDKAGVATDARTGKIPVDAREQTNVDNIFAIGDVILGKPELTPVAIEAGRLLAARLFGGGTRVCDYVNVPTTVFTPLEYGCCGLAEEAAIELLGAHSVEVYHQSFQPLEWTVAHREENACYAKIIVNKADKERVVGLHVLGPNAGEITQGFAIALKMHATKADLDRLIGIHPTCAEVFTTMDTTKSSGIDVSASGC